MTLTVLPHRLRPLASIVVFVVGVVAAAASGVAMYQMRGLYGGPVTTGYHREWDPETKRYLLTHETTTKAGLHIRRVLDDGLRVQRLFMNGEEVNLNTKAATKAAPREGFSTRGDEVIDAWATTDASGVMRVEVSTKRDGKIDRWEQYVNGQLVRADVDTNANGKADRWMRYEDGILVETVIDADEDGRPDAPRAR